MAKRIAIVEDEAAIRENYAAAFRREGYLVDTFAAREPALQAFDAPSGEFSTGLVPPKRSRKSERR